MCAQRGTCSWFWASLQIVDLLLDEDLDAKSRGAPFRALTVAAGDTGTDGTVSLEGALGGIARNGVHT